MVVTAAACGSSPAGGGGGGGGADAQVAAIDGAPGAADGGGGPSCAPGDAGVTFSPGLWQAHVFTSGNLIDEPVGLAFDGAGTLLVVTSHSWLGADDRAGAVVAVDAAGNQQAHASGAALRGPAYAAFAPSGSPFSGLYLGIEDGDEQGDGHDAILRVQGGSITELSTVGSEHGPLAFAPGGAYGTDLYVASRTFLLGMPNELRLFRLSSGGARAQVTIERDGAELLGATAFAFDADGDGLLLATLDDPIFTPGSVDALWRVDGDGVANLVSGALRLRYLARAPAGGPLSGYAYGVTATGGLIRIDDSDRVETIGFGFGQAEAIAFDPAGAMYVADSAAGHIVQITPCPDL